PALALGVWAARRRLLDEPERHRALLGRVAAWGIAIGVVGGVPLMLFDTRSWTPGAELSVPFYALHNVTGLATGFGYAALIGLIATRRGGHRSPVALTRALAACGQRSLTCYLLQSVAFVAIFTPLAGGLGARVGDAAASGIAVLVWAATVALAALMARAGRRGPFEVLLRRLTYGPRATRRAGGTGGDPSRSRRPHANGPRPRAAGARRGLRRSADRRFDPGALEVRVRVLLRLLDPVDLGERRDLGFGRLGPVAGGDRRDLVLDVLHRRAQVVVDQDAAHEFAPIGVGHVPGQGRDARHRPGLAVHVAGGGRAAHPARQRPAHQRVRFAGHRQRGVPRVEPRRVLRAHQQIDDHGRGEEVVPRQPRAVHLADRAGVHPVLLDALVHRGLAGGEGALAARLVAECLEQGFRMGAVRRLQKVHHHLRQRHRVVPGEDLAVLGRGLAG